MLFNSYSYETLQGDIKLLPVTVNNRLKFETEIVHDLSCHPILWFYVLQWSWFLHHVPLLRSCQTPPWCWSGPSTNCTAMTLKCPSSRSSTVKSRAPHLIPGRGTRWTTTWIRPHAVTSSRHSNQVLVVLTAKQILLSVAFVCPYLCVCLFMHVPVSVCLSLSVCLSVCLCVRSCLSVCVPLSVCLFVCLSMCLCLSVSISLCVHVFVCLHKNWIKPLMAICFTTSQLN